MGNGQGKPIDLNGEGKLSLLFAAIPVRTAVCPSCHMIRSETAEPVFCCIAFPKEHAANNILPPVVSLNHFRLLRVVGRGAFGKVRIVERKDTSLSFALKYIRKDEG